MQGALCVLAVQYSTVTDALVTIDVPQVKEQTGHDRQLPSEG